MTAMRVYLGSDHAGYELKQEIIEHLRKTGHEPIDCGAYAYDAEDDYPAFCIAAAVKTVADPGSLGIVLGGSGNGEQIAANKVPGARCALGWSVETASLARQHNNAQLIGIGGRMHTARGAGHRRRLPDHTVVGSRTPPTPYRHPGRLRTHPRRAAGARRPGLGMPEGHTLHRLARLHQRRFGRAPVTGVQPAGPVRRRRRGGQRPGPASRPAPGASTCSTTTRAAGSCTCTWACTAPSPRSPIPMPLPVGQVRMRMVGAEYGTDLRGPTVCEVIDEAEIADVVARLGPDPLRRDADPAPAWTRITKSRRPIGALLMDQAVIAGIGNVYRNELLYRHRIDPYRPGSDDRRRRIRRDVDRSGRVDEGRVAPRQDRRGASRTRPRRAVLCARRARAPTSTAAPASRAGCAERRSAPRCWRAATCSGARPARSKRSSRRHIDATICGWN